MSEIEPRLIAVRGPLKGSILVLPEGDYTIGRQSSNNLCLEDHAVSRQHCVIKRSGGSYIVNDLESRNGTFVNGTAVTEQRLGPGDEIRIGASVFLYLVSKDTAPGDGHPDSKTRELRLSDSVYLSSDENSALPPSFRAIHDLRTLLRLSTMEHPRRRSCGLIWQHC
jgi:pSer/pThr/pTyr-binding forkhead associated (FHA) protein